MDLLSGGPAVRRIEFVPAVRKDAHSVDIRTLDNFILLNDPIQTVPEVRHAAMHAGLAVGRHARVFVRAGAGHVMMGMGCGGCTLRSIFIDLHAIAL